LFSYLRIKAYRDDRPISLYKNWLSQFATSNLADIIRQIGRMVHFTTINYSALTSRLPIQTGLLS